MSGGNWRLVTDEAHVLTHEKLRQLRLASGKKTYAPDPKPVKKPKKGKK